MPAPDERLQEGFATVYLTLSSVIIALVLEKLFDRMVAVAPLPPADLSGVLVWLQGALLLVVAFSMFIITAYFVLALRWEIGVADAGGPFVLLIVLAAAITAIGRGAGPAFFYIAGLGQAFGGVVFAQVVREAGRDPRNHEVLDRSDLTWTYILGFTESAIALVTAVLLHLGMIGVGGAAIGTGILLTCMLTLIYMFARSAWPVIGQRSGIERGAPAAGRLSD